MAASVPAPPATQERAPNFWLKPLAPKTNEPSSRTARYSSPLKALTELYRRAGYLITLTHAPSWKEKFGDEADDLRRAAEAEFATTARAINRRAEAIGTEADYDEKWGK